MMDDSNPFGPSLHAPTPEPEPEPAAAEPAATPAQAPTEQSAAVLKFKSCRWKASEGGEFCTHRDVLPFAGKEGFVPESWCPDCQFYKLRRTPKKREYTY